MFRVTTTVAQIAVFVIAGVTSLSFMSTPLAQRVAQNHPAQVTAALFPTAADYLLISYSLHQEILAINDTVPLLRIYGDGRVLVHRPEYLKQSGDYQMYLTVEELQALCLEMTQRGVMTYQDKVVAGEIAEAQRQSNLSHTVSDAVHSSIVLNLHAVRINSRSTAAVGKRRHIIKNAQARAQLFPSIQLLGDVAYVERQLNKFIYSPKLQPLP